MGVFYDELYAKDAEIDHLRAELAALKARIAEVNHHLSYHEHMAKDDAAKLEAAKARIAELESARAQIELANKEFGDQLAHAHVQLAEAKARIAELEPRGAIADLVSNLRGRVAELLARAERAEAERHAMRELLQIVWNGFTADPEDPPLTPEQIQRVRAALSSHPAGRPSSPLDEATERLFPGAIAHVRAETEAKAMREALEKVRLRLKGTRLNIGGDLAAIINAALAPSPAGREG